MMFHSKQVKTYFKVVPIISTPGHTVYDTIMEWSSCNAVKEMHLYSIARPYAEAENIKLWLVLKYRTTWHPSQ